jgi:hypothetical protein
MVTPIDSTAEEIRLSNRDESAGDHLDSWNFSSRDCAKDRVICGGAIRIKAVERFGSIQSETAMPVE